MLTYPRQRGKKGERGRETLMQERNTDQLPHIYTLTRDWTHNQACALSANGTHDPLVCGTMLQLTEPGLAIL